MHFLTSGNAGLAVFEVTGPDQVTVSATLGYSKMLYREVMSKDQAREQWKDLQSKNWKKTKGDNSYKFNNPHNYVWNFYR